MKKSFTLLYFTLFLSMLGLAQSPPWQALGPIKFPTNIVWQINGMGRTTQLKFHPTNPAKLYATSASGGFWMSNDTGRNWYVSGTDSLPKTNLASVCIDYTNDQIIYLGTGDPNYYSTDYGIYKSVNGGATWTPIISGIGTRMALEILMSPFDHNTLIAATNDGIWKTTDGGASWSMKQSGRFLDMKMKAVSNTSTIFASSATQFMKSTDMGETWSIINAGITLLPDLGDGGGSRIAVTKADTNRVYLLLLNNGGTVFRSDNSGDSFRLVHNQPDTSIVGYDFRSPGQGNYNMSFAVSNVDADEVYVNTHAIQRSQDGGSQFYRLTTWPTIVHTDMHQTVFSPYFPDRLYNMNDGGIWMSLDHGVSWQPLNDGYSTTEIYHAGQSPTKDFIIAGTQDNGGIYYNKNHWYTYQGGDVTTAWALDYSDRQLAYQLENGFHRSPLLGGYDSTYLPTAVKGNDVKMLFDAEHPSISFASKTDIYRCLDNSATPPAWTAITSSHSKVMDMQYNPLDKNTIFYITVDSKVWRMNDAQGSSPAYYNISTVPASSTVAANILVLRSDTNVVFTTCGSKVFRSANGGTTWTNYSGSLPSINIIKMVQDELAYDQSIYVCTAKGVYYRNDTMSDWQKYSKGLPSIADIVDFMAFDDGSVNRSLRVAYFGRGTYVCPYKLIKDCFPPTALSATNSGNNVLVNWSGGINTTIAYRKESEVQWTTVEAGAASSYTLTGLNGCEKYEIRVRTNCALDRSLWSSSVFISTPGYPLPSIWTSEDIGPVALAGNVCYDAIHDAYAVTSAGTDVWDNADQFYYVHTPFSGDIEASCRVSRLGAHYGWAKAGLMIRETLNPDSKQSMVCLTPDNGVARQQRLATAGGSDNNNIGGIHAPVYLKIARIGDYMNTFYSFDGSSWIFINGDTNVMNTNAFIGLFSCSHEENYLNTAVIDKVRLSNHPTLSVADIKNTQSFDIKLYPNPATDHVEVELISAASATYSINIIDMLGHVLCSRQLSFSSGIDAQSLDISKLSAGLYQIQVANKNGSVQRSFVKQ